MISNVVEGIEKAMSDKQPGKQVGVKHFPDMNVLKWNAWGLPVARVLRAPRYNFIMQPVKNQLFRTDDEEPAYITSGIWYRIDEKIERKIEKTSWVAYAVLVILIGVMIKLVAIGSAIAATFTFIVMYMIAEGFMPIILARTASDFRSVEEKIPFRLVKHIDLIADSGVILLSWDDDGEETGIALGFTLEKARIEYDSLKEKVGAHAKFAIHEGRLLGNPPSAGK